MDHDDGAGRRWCVLCGNSKRLTDAGALARSLLGIGGAATIAVSLLPQPNTGHVPAASIGFVLLAIWPAFSVLPPRRLGIAITGFLLALLAWLVVALSGQRLLGLVSASLPVPKRCAHSQS